MTNGHKPKKLKHTELFSEEAKSRELEERERMRHEAEKVIREKAEKEMVGFMRNMPPEEQEKFIRELPPDIAHDIRVKLGIRAEQVAEAAAQRAAMPRFTAREIGEISWNTVPFKTKEAMLQKVWPSLDAEGAKARFEALREAFIEEMSDLAARGGIENPEERREAILRVIKRLKSGSA